MVLAAVWLAAGWLAAGWLAAGWLAAGWLPGCLPAANQLLVLGSCMAHSKSVVALLPGYFTSKK